MMVSNTKLVYLILILGLSLLLEGNLTPGGNTLVGAEKKTDILFVKGKFIMKNKKGAIVIADEKKPCHCPKYYR